MLRRNGERESSRAWPHLLPAIAVAELWVTAIALTHRDFATPRNAPFILLCRSSLSACSLRWVQDFDGWNGGKGHLPFYLF